MENYNDLKKDTFLFLTSNNEQAVSLVIASLIISFYFEKCIHKTNDKLKPLVSKSFLKECANLLTFYNDNGKISALDAMQKINLIRGKLAHGDFVVSPFENSIIINTSINDENIFFEVPIDSIVEFANHIAEYSRHAKSSEKRETVYFKNGFKYTLIDTPNKSFERNNKYDSKFNDMIHYFLNPEGFSKHTFILEAKSGPNRLSFKMFDIVYHITDTDEKDSINEYPNRKDFEWGLLQKLNNPQNNNYLCSNFIESLALFYKYYIYPLENFLKGEDKNTASLLNEEMFGFEKLNIDEKVLKEVPYVGRVENYFNNNNPMYDKINNLYNELVKAETDDNNPHYDNTEKKNKIEEKLNPYIDVISNPLVMKLYSYGKKRSFIEHIRCSIEHGTYNFDNKTITFIDSWQDKHYEYKTSLKDFYQLFSYENINLIIEQFEKVYNFKSYFNQR